MKIKKELGEKRVIIRNFVLLALFTIIIIGYLSLVYAVDPVGPDEVTWVSNSTKGDQSSGHLVNVSGGYISTFTFNATIQNDRWKAFIGNVTGKFTLDDSTDSTIYDWTIASITGRVYATRNTSSITWSNVNCSNRTYLETENSNLDHTNINDNLSATFSDATTHAGFYVAGDFVAANSCPALYTYINNSSQSTDFSEIALYSAPSHIFATILESDVPGYNAERYDFQMIVPENGSDSWEGAIPYYLYVELGT